MIDPKPYVHLVRQTENTYIHTSVKAHTHPSTQPQTYEYGIKHTHIDTLENIQKGPTYIGTRARTHTLSCFLIFLTLSSFSVSPLPNHADARARAYTHLPPSPPPPPPLLLSHTHTQAQHKRARTHTKTLSLSLSLSLSPSLPPSLTHPSFTF